MEFSQNEYRIGIEEQTSSGPRPATPIFQIIISGILSLGLLGASFWAGAAYNRLDGVERNLITVNATLRDMNDKLTDFQTVKAVQSEHERRIMKLEDNVRQMR